MFRLLVILSLLPGISASRPDSLVYARLDSMITEYTLALRTEDTPVKCKEVDFMISSCSDSAARSHIAIKLYSNYVDSPVMGEEEVAIHIYDKWFATGEVKMNSETDLLNARIFADFNRNSLIGMDAPVLEMENLTGARERVPVKGKTCLLYFYDVSCPSCSTQTILLPYALGEVDFDIEFIAIYTGADRKAWETYCSEKLQFDNPHIRVHHLWDPEIETDYQRMYSILSTPRLFMVEPQGSIIGRRLNAESLGQLLIYAGAIQNLYDKYLK